MALSKHRSKPLDQANLFNAFFHSVFAPPETQNNVTDSPLDLGYEIDTEISDLIITEDVVLKQLQSLDVSKATLGLPSKLIRSCAGEIAPSLCRLFNMSLAQGIFPKRWKDANLVPVHKSDSKSLVNNYMGISLLDVLSKLVERHVFRGIFEIVSPHLSKWQHGFLPGKSTVSQLSQVVHQFSKALEKRQQIDVVYLDFSKAL